MFTELTINNFKNFKHLEVKDIKLVNTISGFNQSGKTTLLEAIYALCYLYSPFVMCHEIANFRKFLATIPEDLLHIFYKFQAENSPLEVQACYEGITRKIQVNLTQQEKPTGYQIQHCLGDATTSSNARLVQQQQPDGSHFIFDQAQITSLDYTANLTTCFIGNNKHLNDIQIQEAIDREGLRATLVDFLNDLFQEQVIDIFRYGNGLDVRIENIPGSVSTRLLGDGFRKALEIFGSWFLGSKVILIDEIENGLHHSLHKKVIASIFKYAHKKHIQVFITTHNQEILTTINEVLTENQQYQQDYSHYMLANTPKGNKAYRLNSEELDSTLASTFDVRDK